VKSVQASLVLENVKRTIPVWEMAGQLFTWTLLWKTSFDLCAIIGSEASSICLTVETLC
jgi:hypothetical protein